MESADFVSRPMRVEEMIWTHAAHCPTLGFVFEGLLGLDLSVSHSGSLCKKESIGPTGRGRQPA